MINNKGNRKGKEREREPERAIMCYYSYIITNQQSNLVIFTNHIFSACTT